MRRRFSAHTTEDDGFTLVEMSVALAVLAVLAMAFASQLFATYKVYAGSKEHTIAEQIATSQIEAGRALAYDDLGTSPGNPPGPIPRDQTVVSGGFTFTVTTAIQFVDDPVPGGFHTGQNMKQMRVTVARAGKTVVDLQTRVPPQLTSSLTKGTINVLVADYALNTPIVGAEVTIAGGPSPTRTDLTDASGRSVFAGLLPTTSPPTDRYSITAAAAGYTTLPVDMPPAPAAYTNLIATQVFNTTIRMFKTVAITTQLVFPDDTPFTYPSTVKITAPSAVDISAPTGAITFSSVGGAPILPSTSYTITATSTAFGGTVTGTAVTKVVPDLYPTVSTSTFKIVMNIPPRAVTINTLDTAGNIVPNTTFRITGGDRNVDLGGTTDATGRSVISLLPSLTPYTVTVPIQGNIASPITQPFTVTNAAVSVNLAVLTPPQVNVLVGGPTGAAVGGAAVVITGGDITLSLTRITALDGSVSIPVPISASPYLITIATLPVGPGSAQLFKVTGPGNFEVYLTETFRFDVKDQANNKLAGQTVRVGGGDLGISVYATTDATGRVEIPLPQSTATYTVTVAASPGFAAFTSTVPGNATTGSRQANITMAPGP